MTAEEVQRILTANRDKNFVRRIQAAGISPVINNPDGSVSTIRMASAEVDGQGIAYPTIIQQKDGTLVQLSSTAAVHHAMQTGQYIRFKSPKEAEAFANNQYKKGSMYEQPPHQKFFSGH